MPRFKPAPLPILIQKFCKHAKPRQLMFCKRYKVEDVWDIGIGAIVDLDAVHPRLIAICQQLYLEDPAWFVGDTKALMGYELG